MVNKHPLPLVEIIPFSTPAIRILDVGALLEGDPIYKPLLKFDNTEVIGFEPQEKALLELIRMYGDRFTWLDTFLGDGEFHTFYQTKAPGCASLFEPNPEIIYMFTSFGTLGMSPFSIETKKTVQTTKLDDVKAVGNVDYIKLDVQGSELMILENGLQTLRKALVIQTESALLPLYHQQPHFSDQYQFLRQQGFELHKFVDVTGRTIKPIAQRNPMLPISQLIEVDAIFVRNLARPDKLSLSELLKAVHILHDVYYSYDLAHYFLLEYDKRAMVSAAEPYYKYIRANADKLPLKFLNLKQSV